MFLLRGPLAFSCLFLLLLIPALQAFVLEPSRDTTVSRRARTPPLASTTATSSHQPLAQHGDWQAFFDEDRYCLMYYFNTKTGASQWEPPEDFPIPKLDSHNAYQRNGAETTAFTRAVVDSTNQRHRQQPVEQEPAGAVIFKAVLGFATTVAGKAAEAVVDHVKKQQQEVSKPWWSNLFQQQVETPTQNLEIVDLLSEIHGNLHSRRTTSQQTNDHHQDHSSRNRKQASTNTAKKQAAFWATWNNNKNDEPTRPLVPPSQREQWIQEKLYADSLKRQENLRKNYRRVIENRSPTISLSALKRSNNNMDWLQYLNDA